MGPALVHILTVCVFLPTHNMSPGRLRCKTSCPPNCETKILVECKSRTFVKLPLSAMSGLPCGFRGDHGHLEGWDLHEDRC